MWRQMARLTSNKYNPLPTAIISCEHHGNRLYLVGHHAFLPLPVQNHHTLVNQSHYAFERIYETFPWFFTGIYSKADFIFLPDSFTFPSIFNNRTSFGLELF